MSVLYLRLPANFCMLLRGKAVEYHNIASDLKYPECILYKPHSGRCVEVIHYLLHYWFIVANIFYLWLLILVLCTQTLLNLVGVHLQSVPTNFIYTLELGSQSWLYSTKRHLSSMSIEVIVFWDRDNHKEFQILTHTFTSNETLNPRNHVIINDNIH